MSDFTQLQSQLAAARSAEEDAARALHADRQRLARAKRARSTAERFGKERLAAAQAGVREQERAVARADARLTAARERARAEHDRFLALSDPRRHLGNLDDATPFLLLPLRIETRFKLAEPGGSPRSNELWVRVFPDEFAVDTFEETLSESELRRLKAYWLAIWAAGGVEADRRGAWKVFAGSLGSGRAHWLQGIYRPEGDPPLKTEGVTSVILAIGSEEALPDAEQSALASYWEAVWRAPDAVAQQAVAAEALAASLGAARAEALRSTHVPANLRDPAPAGADRASVPLEVAFALFPSSVDMPLRAAGWTRAPSVEILPDRLVLLGFNAGEKVLEELGAPIPDRLEVGPDPEASEDEQLKPVGAEHEDITLGTGLEWIADFERAVALGMGFRVPLSDTQFRRGFDQLMVLGVRMKSNAAAGRQALAALLTHHKQSRAGFEILAQGAATNNVETAGASYGRKTDADTSFERYFGAPGDDPAGWYERQDGRWLAGALGLPFEFFYDVAGGRGLDVRDALAMNTLLWPATGGYYMDALLDTVFEPPTIERAREFFVKHVSARGRVPAVRVGRQPYGILPAAPRSRLRWLRPRPRAGTSVPPPAGELGFLAELYALLRRVEADFRALDGRIAWLGKPGSDPQQTLLDVVGLHPGSIEHYQRYAESYQQLYNRMRMEGAGEAAGFLAAIQALAYTASGQQLLQRLGHVPGNDAGVPDLLEKLFLREPNLLTGGLVQDIPSSESDPLRAYTETGSNYLRWLAEAAGSSHDQLRQQKGFSGGIPRALLYALAHHALDLSYVEVSQLLLLNAGLITAAQRKARRREPAFIQITGAAQTAAQPAESRWTDLYRTAPDVTGSDTMLIGEHVAKILKTHVATAYLARQIDALQRLEARPSAALERAFAEHLDLFSYRLDAWYGGLLSYQLETMRSKSDGLYLGAYGWLEDVRPEFKQLSKVELPPALQAIFERPGEPPLTRDSTNAGYIHAPSLNHAVTAAVLRNGYLSNATPENPDSLAINLSSERVRWALQTIEGMQSGLSLGALLGYQFERGLHDRHDAEVDAFIYELRSAFPLASGRLAATRVSSHDELGKKIHMRQVEARNVIDGLALVEHIRATGAATYPFAKADLPEASPEQRDAISAEAERIVNIADATADLALAEGVHQVVQGNYERAGATLDTFSKGKFPQTPDVIRTPRSGIGLTHRVALHVATGFDPALESGPRARAEPALNAWLASRLPAPARIACRVTLTDPDDGTASQATLTQAELGLSALDLLFMVDVDNEPTMRALDNHIERHVIATLAPRPHITIAIEFVARLPEVAEHVPFFELAALLRPLRALLLRSRALRPTDLTLAQEAERSAEAAVSIDPRRISLNRDALASSRASLQAFVAPLEARIAADETALIIAELDDNIAAFVAQLTPLAPFAQLRAETGHVFAERRRLFSALQGRVADYVAGWDRKLSEFDAGIAEYDALPPASSDVARFLALQKAERLITTVPTDPLPPTPAELRAMLDVRRAAFNAQRDLLASLPATHHTLSALVQAIDAQSASNESFVVDAIDLSEPIAQLRALAEDMATHGTGLLGAIDTRIARIDALLTEAGSGHGTAAVSALEAAAKALFGEDFQLLPELTLPSTAALELANAWGAGTTPDSAILDYVKTVRGRAFPVDDWLHGVARVREKLHSFESAALLLEALGGAELALAPLQLPHRPGVPWLAMELPETGPDGVPFAVDEDKLLYTAHFTEPLAPSGPIAGLLLDEWTEVIPARSEETGLAVHYDRPNCEAPQVLLLALPADFTGAWQWQDLIDTVRETMDMARLRAIEPDHLDATAYARLLPAAIFPVTHKPITAALNLAVNNGLLSALSAQESDDA